MHETRAFVLGNWLQYNEPEAYEEYVEQIISHRLASPEEAIAARHGEWHDIPPTDKIRAYDQLVTMVDTFLREHPGGVIGLAPITANPPHYGHANLLRVVRQACAQLSEQHLVLVGIDSLDMLRARKGEARFPRAAALMNSLSPPWADYGFVYPYAAGEPRDMDTFFSDLCRDLHITVFGSSSDNVLLPNYLARMRQTGGCVVTVERLDNYSSTHMMEDRGIMSMYVGIPPDGVLGEFEEWTEAEEAKTRAALRARGFTDPYLDQM